MAYDIFNKYNLYDIDDNASLTDTAAAEWKQVETKSVRDADGFMTEYTWYTNGDLHIFMFGDSDLVEPDEAYADWTCETEQEAQEWFSSYNGFEDEDDELSFFDAELDESILDESYNNLPDWLIKFLDTHRDGKSIKKTVSQRGVDLHNCKYVRAPFPRSNRDPILKDNTKLKIFKLLDHGDEVIFIYDVNNPYMQRPNNSEWRYVNDMPMKDILDLAIEFGYIDLNDPTNNMRAKQVERSNQAYALRDVTRDLEKGQHAVYHHTYGKKPNGRTDWNNIVSTSISWVTKDGYDKSGYKLDPEKYRRMLDDVGLENYGARLQSYYNKLEATRARIISLMTNLQFDGDYDYRNNSWHQNIFGDVAEATDRLSRAMDYYQRIKRACAEIVEDRKELNSEENIENTNQMIKHVFMFDGKNLMDNLTDARDLIKALEAAKLKA